MCYDSPHQLSRYKTFPRSVLGTVKKAVIKVKLENS